MKFVLYLLLFSFLLGLSSESYAQTPTTNYGGFAPCAGSINLYTFDFTNTNLSTITQTGIGVSNALNECCGLPASSNGCIFFDVIVDPGATGVQFNLGGAGGDATISYLSCAATYGVGVTICLDPNLTVHRFMFCRSGNTTYEVSFTQVSPAFPGNLAVTEGCTIPLSVSGLNPATVVWNVIEPGPSGTWNNLLSPTSGSLNTVLTPVTGSPSSVTIQVCGNLAGACSSLNFCSQSTVTIYPDLFIGPLDNLAICQGAAPGTTVTSTATAIGGSPPFTYTWQGVSGAATGFTYSTSSSSSTVSTGLSLIGGYTVTITDVNGCATAQGTMEVYNYDTAIQAFITSPAVSVCASPVPTINLTGYVTETNAGVWSASTSGTFGSTAVTSGSAPGTSTTWTPSSTTPGTVTFTLTPTNTFGCPFTPATIDINLTQFTSTLGAVPTNVSCFGGSSGAIDLTITQGTPSYATSSILWSNGATSEDLSGLTAGSYSVTVTDVNGCVGTFGPVTITEPPVLDVQVSASSNETCDYSNNGSITVTGTGGTGVYSYSITSPTAVGPQASSTFSGLTGTVAGTTYTIQIADANGCTDQITQVITEPLPLDVQVSASSNETCDYSNNGSITVTGTGGTGVYSYSITSPTAVGPQASSTFSGLTGTVAGTTYTIQITDANGCTDQITQVITEPLPLDVQVSASSNETCDYSNNGSITVTGTGGTGVYSYSITSPTAVGPQASSTFSGLTGTVAGTTYTIQITDANGCTDQITQVITEPLPLDVQVSASSNETCDYSNNGSITVTGTGGTGVYSYSITSPTAVGPQASSTFSGLTGTVAGTTYTIQIADANGCTDQITQVITEPLPLDVQVSASSNETCDYSNNGSITVTGTGGTGVYSYSITSPTAVGPQASSTFSGLTGTVAGTTYTIQIADANGCTDQITQVITEPLPLDVQVSASSNETCDYSNNGSITVTGTGGTGVYSYSITSPTAVGPQASSTFSGLTGTVAGTTYTIQITDANGCTDQITQVITEPLPLDVQVSASSNETCDYSNNGSITVTGTGGTGVYSYSITSPTAVGPQASSTFSGLTGTVAGTTYTIQIADANGCTDQITQVITEPLPLDVQVSASSNETCDYSNNGSITVTGTGGTGVYSYSITSPTAVGPQASSTFSGLTGTVAGTTYTIQIADANGCTDQITQVITEPLPLDVQVSASSNETCDYSNNGSITVTGTGGTGVYSYSITSPTAVGPQASSTFSGLTGTVAGTTYTIQIADANGCTDQITQVITEPLPLDVQVSASSNETCDYSNNGSITVTGTGGTGVYSYSITSPTAVGPQASSTFSGLTGTVAGTTYTIQITDANGCTDQITQVITEPLPLITDAAVTSNYNNFGVSCGDITTGPDNNGNAETVSSGGTGAYTYLWTTSDGTIPAGQETAQTPTGLTAGTYDVLVTDANNCTVTDQIVVIEPVVLTLDNLEPSIYAGGFNLSGCDPDGTIDLTVSGGVGPYTYSWNGGAFTTEDLTALPAGTYTVLVTDANNCTVTGTINLTEPSGLTIDATSPTFASGTNISCFGLSDGNIDLVVTGGTPGYTYSWTSTDGYTSSTEDPSNIPAGEYSVTVTDDNDCQITTTITLIEPPVLTVTSIVTTDYNGFGISCFGLSDGGLVSTPTGGSGLVATDYVYSWDTNPATGVVSTDQNPSGLPAGDYTVTVTDINGCTATSDVTIIEPTVVTSASSVTSDYNGFGVSCFGSSDGSLGSTPGGGVTTLPYTFEWNTDPLTTVVSTDQNPTGLPTGSYTVTITDANGCTSTTVPVLITEPTVVTSASLVSSDYNGFGVSCFGSSDGSLGSTPGGGVITLPYTFEWNTDPATTVVSTDQNPSGLPTGSYTVTITDANGCTSTTVPVLITEPTVVTAASLVSSNYNGFGVSCFGASDGSLGSTPGGGTTTLPYLFAWDTDPTSGGTISTAQNPTGLPAGDYVVTITDANGCFATTVPVTITEPPLLTTTTSNTTDYNTFGVSCGDIVTGPDNDGGIDATPAGGTPTYTYLWTTSDGTIPAGQETAQTPTGLTAGTYDVLVTDANNCTVTDQIVVIEPVVLTLDNLEPSIYAGGFNLSGCDPDGTIDLTVSGGVGPYTYSWNGGAFTTEDLTALPAGTYTVLVTDANNCTVTGTINLTEPSGLTIDATSPTYASGDNISCFGLSDGNIDLVVTGGTPGYTYSWTSTDGYTSSTEDPSNIPAGEYSVTVTDDNGCQITTTITLIEPPVLTVTSIVTTDYNGFGISCFGLSDGGLVSTPTGGSGLVATDYVYSWDTNPATGVVSTDQNPSGLPAGDYTVTVTDINGCTATSDVTIIEPTVVTSASSVTSDYNGFGVSCFGSSDGSLGSTPGGGVTTLPYTFEWNTDPLTTVVSTDQNPTGLPTGSYTVTITDANGCTSTTVPVLITEPTVVTSASLVSSDYNGFGVSCFGSSDGSLGSTPGGGVITLPYTFEWNTDPATTVVSTDQNPSGLPTGSYTVTITDANGCTSTTVPVLITEPTVVTAASLVSSNYNGFGVSCFGASDGSLGSTPGGGTTTLPYLFAWDTDPTSGGTISTAQNPTGLPAGDYVVTITDANGCFATTVPVTITEPPLLTTTTSNTTDYNTFGVSCGDIVTGPDNDGGIDATPAGGTPTYTYLWTTSDGTIPAGQETAQTPTGLTAGTYDVLVTDANNCTVTDQIVVIEPVVLTLDNLEPSIYAGGFNLSGCDPDGTIDLTVSGGVGPYTYSWNGGAFTTEDLTALPAGTYTVLVTDANNCTVTGTINLTEPSGLTIDATSPTYASGDNISCFGLSDGNIDLVVTGGTPGYTYSWTSTDGYTSSTEDPSNIPAGEYSVTVTDDNGCQIATTIILTEPIELVQDITSPTFPSGDNISCFEFNDGTIDYTVTGGSPIYTYTWTTSDGTGLIIDAEDQGGLTTGTYTVTVTDLNGCQITETITLTEPVILTSSLDPSIYAGGYNLSGCLPDGSIDLTVVGGSPDYTYSWNGGTYTTEDINTLPAGDYEVVVTDINGCITVSTITLTEPSGLTIDATSPTYASGDNISCFGLSDGNIDLVVTGGTPGYTYSWTSTDGYTSSTEDPSNIPAGEYSVTVTDDNGCEISTTITLIEPILLVQDITSPTFPSGDNISCFEFNDGTIDYTVTGGSPIYTYTWTTSDGTGLIIDAEDQGGLTTGTYTVTVTDLNGCQITETITLTEPVILTSSLDPSIYAGGYNLSGCLPDGSIDLTVVGGSPDYTYSWNGGTYTTEDINTLPAGDYEVVVTDINGCITVSTITLTEPSGLTIDATSPTYASGDNISCFGLSDGNIDLVVTGGTPGYTYSWTSTDGYTSSTEDPSNIPAGEYSVTVTDDNGCEISTTITLIEPILLVQDITSPTFPSGDNISCFEFNDGTIDYTVTGGSPIYTYTWTTSDGTGLIIDAEDQGGLTTGTYTVTVTDLNGCQITETITLTEPVILTSSLDPSIYAGGYNLSGCLPDGSIDLTVVGGSPDYTYSWNGGTYTTEDINTLPAGDYEVVVTDINGCITVSTITLTEPSGLTIDATSPTYASGDNISCFGLSDGNIDLVVTGGTPGYTYSWTSTDGYTSSTEDPSNIPAGEYSVTVTDDNGCEISTTITLIEPILLVQDITSPTFPSGDNISCFEFNDGTIDYTVTGGSPIYTYTWTTSDGTGLIIDAEDQGGLTTGTYTVTVTDLNGCQITETITLTEPVILTSSLDPSIYAGGYNLSGCLPDGSIDLTVVGGSPDYTYSWNGGTYTTEDINTLPAGDYEVVVTDINGCITVSTITLTEPSGLTIDATSPTYASGDNISCFGLSDGNIDLVVTGGTPGYTYSWTSTDGYTSSTEDPSNIPAGEYSVTVTDDNGCEISTTITLIEPILLVQDITSPTFPSGDNISCFEFNDGTIDYVPSGGSPGYTYVWSTTDGSGITQGQEDQENLTAGTYQVVMTDINGCQQTTTITLTQPTPLTIGLTPSIYAGGFNLSGCAPDGSIDATVGGGSPGYTYSWSPTSQVTEDITDLPAGTYTVTVTDINGCIITDEITLVQPPIVTVTTAVTSNYNGQQISCTGFSDGAVISSPNGGATPYTYQWTDALGTVLGGDQSLTGQPQGTYTVLVTDANGCTATEVITLVDPPAIDASGVVSTNYNGQDVTCFGATDGAIDLTVNGGTPGYNYNWVNQNGTFVSSMQDPIGVGAGTYTVTITDLNGCVFTTDVVVTEPEPLNSEAVVITDYNGQNVSCYESTDGGIQGNATGGTPGYSYTWTFGGAQIGTGQVVDNVGAGNYNVTINDLNGCLTTSVVTVTQPSPVVANISILSNYFGAPISCTGAEDGIASVSYIGGTPGYAVSWNTNPAQTTDQVNNFPEGTWTVTVTDINGCVTTADVIMWANPLPDFTAPESVIGCIGSPLIIDANAEPGTNCEWTFSNGTVINECGPFEMTFSQLLCLDIQLVVSTPQGCRDTVSTADFICVAPNPVAAFTISEYDLYTTDYDAYFYNVSEGADAYYWDFGDGTNSTEVNPYHQFPTEGYEFFEIWLTAISEYGCLDSTVRYIRFHPELIYYVPNSFTPDGDDYNNVFKPVISSGYSLDNFNFMIFNRWGELIYESNDITTVGWDGTYRGSKCQEGVYIWKMAIMNSDTDRKEEAVGHVTLLRGAGLK
jgi:gliding motility-associated-like protein